MSATWYKLTSYNYGKAPNILTSLEIEVAGFTLDRLDAQVEAALGLA